jgi:hypothetical protein
MPAINGNVEALSIKEMEKEDQFGNTHRASLKMGDDWYSYGSIKREAVNIKTGNSWTQLAKGMEIEFMYDQNGDFKNIKKKTFSITDATCAEPQVQPVQQSAPARRGNVNPAEVGQCMNLAESVLGYSGKDLLNPEKVTEAIAWYKEVRVLFTELYEGVSIQEKVAKVAPPPPPSNNYDDDEV